MALTAICARALAASRERCTTSSKKTCATGRGQGDEVRDGHGVGSQVVRKGIQREVVEQVRAEDGRLTLAETLRHRVTYFTLGVALGSRGFVDEFFDVRREQFDSRRKRGARPMKGGSFARMFAFRAPRVAVV